MPTHVSISACETESLALRNMISILADRPSTSSEQPADYEQLAATIAAATAKQTGSSLLPEKITFSKYDGKMDALVIHSWFYQFTSYFAITQKTDTQKVLLANKQSDNKMMVYALCYKSLLECEGAETMDFEDQKVMVKDIVDAYKCMLIVQHNGPIL